MQVNKLAAKSVPNKHQIDSFDRRRSNSAILWVTDDLRTPTDRLANGFEHRLSTTVSSVTPGQFRRVF